LKTNAGHNSNIQDPTYSDTFQTDTNKFFQQTSNACKWPVWCKHRCRDLEIIQRWSASGN